MTGWPSFSASRRPSESPWRRRLREAPSLVAETLERVRDPLVAWLNPGEPAPPVGVAARLARGLLPATAPDQAPAWLRSHQRLAFARALAAARRHRGVLVADRPGTGKSWIGLAVALGLEPDRPVHVVAPASLRAQWIDIAERAGAVMVFHSCESLSRGRPPDPAPGALVLDESHRLRNPLARRYLTLAPWCVGRRGVLLSATPIVNRIDDVIHQLLLLVRDDALAWAGVPSLRRIGPENTPGELSRLIVTGEDVSDRLPARRSSELRTEGSGDSALPELQRGIAALRLSSDPGTARLIRVSLLGALASSPQAICEALARYRSLLLHARDASASGRALTRHAIRRLVGGELDQLVLWPMVAEGSSCTDLAASDLDLLPPLEARARAWTATMDSKCRALKELLRDPKPTLVFTNARATVQYLRRRLGTGIAWCTGDRSGIDAMPIPRADALDLLRKPPVPRESGLARPMTLVATDIASEGLDLPLTARVVHYDLPWTAVRLDQRSGRAFRLSSTRQSVEVVRFLPPFALERALQREAILIRKADLPNRLGLGEGIEATWRVRAQTAKEWDRVPVSGGFAVLRGTRSALITGLRFQLSDGSCEEVVLAQVERTWTRDDREIAGLLRLARTSSSVVAGAPGIARGAIGRITGEIRRRLRTMGGRRLEIAPRDPASAGLRRRLLEQTRSALQRRNLVALDRLERGLRLLRRGRSAGEDLLVRSWREARLDNLLQRLSSLGDEPPPPDVVQVELVALLLIRRGGGPS